VRLSLRRKIVGGFGLLLALIVILGWVTLSLFNSLRSVQSRVFNEAFPGLVTVDQIVRSYTAQSAAISRYLISGQERILGQYSTEVETSRFWERQATELFSSGEERTRLERIKEAGQDFHRLVENKVIPRAAGGERTLAFSLLGERGEPLISNIETNGQILRRLQGDLVTESEMNLRRRNTQAIVTLSIVTIGALAVGVLVAFILPRRLASNISRLVEAVRATGRGDFNRRVEINSGDEVEELAVRFGEMQAGLQRLQQLVAQDRELEIAASIQQNLLQRTLPQTSGVTLVPIQRQANLVGGDWYDVDAAPGGLSVVVGDASGKGIGAALIATVTLSVLRAERRLGATTRRIIQRANEALREATDPDSFTTLIYATVDIESGEVRWFNMGHPAPFLLRVARDGAQPRGYFVEGPRNRALGWFEDPGVVETVIRTEPGDRLIFYTDGFLEAKAGDGSIFGEERFAAELMRHAPLAPEALGDDVVAGVERFAAGKLDDDLTMLILEFQGVPLREGVRERLTGDEPWHSRR
jgi:serine phosphatase RsbU (regulator of sigma subunit)/CHASE3 domain sensor protein